MIWVRSRVESVPGREDLMSSICRNSCRVVTWVSLDTPLTHFEVQTLALCPDDLAMHQADNALHLVRIFKFFESHQISQQCVCYPFLGESLRVSSAK
jgi:hypothetical protein